jgi:amidase
MRSGQDAFWRPRRGKAGVIMEGEPQPADCWVPGSSAVPATGSGPLSGVTLAVKDMFAIEGHVSSFGLARWRETHSPSKYTAPALDRLLAAGASIAGLARLDQLAWSIVGNVAEGTAPLNPAQPDRFTCGSSSGPASAVAAGLADVGLGTDTGGSVRAPAAACGLYGLRPTHGLVSAEGVLALAPSFDTVGILARDLASLGPALHAIADQGPGGPATGVVLVPVDSLAGVSESTSDAVQGVAAVLAKRAVCRLAEAELGEFLNGDVVDLFSRIQGRQAWTMHGPWLAANIDALAPDVAARVRRGQRLSATPQDEQDADERAWRAYTTAFGERVPADTVVILPVMPDLPPLRSASADELAEFRAGALRFTSPASLTGRPELVIPVRHAASGKLVGVGILGPAGSDRELLRLAGAICPRHGPLVV